jgi:tetratricopeptide (TPR) repeat protein
VPQRFLRLLAFAACITLIPTFAVAAPSTVSAFPVVRNDYANAKFSAALAVGLKAFYTKQFGQAVDGFNDALAIVPDNTLAISFLNAAAAQNGTLESLIANEEDVLGKNSKNYLAHARLGFSYLFSSQVGHNRDVDAREELNAAIAIDPKNPAAHVGLGVMRFNERSTNRAKTEFLAALDADKNNVLAREYLGQIYQLDLKDPQRGLAYVIDVPNVVPGYADIDFHIGSLLYDLNQKAQAIKWLQQAIDIDIGHVGEAGQHGFTLLAQAYLDEHKVAEARKVLHEAIISNSDAPYAQTILAKIDRGVYDEPKPKDTKKKP